MIESILKDTGKDALRYLPAKVVPAIVNFIGLFVFTHIFSPEDYGNYFIILTTISVITIVGSNWITNSVVRFYPEFKVRDDLDGFFTNTVFVFIICNCPILLLYVLGFFLFESQISGPIVPFFSLGLFAYLSSAIYFVLLYCLMASLQATAFSICEIIFSIGKFILALVLVVFFKMGAISLLWGMLLISISLSILISKKFSLVKRLRTELLSKEVYGSFFKYGLPLAISSLCTWLLVLSDRYILQHLRAANEVGIYSVSFVVVDGSIAMLYSILMLAAYPIIVLTWEEKGKDITQKLIKELSRYYFILCIPAFVGLVALGKDVFTLFAGEAFIESFRLVPLFAFCSFIMGLFQYVNKGFEIYKKTLLLALIFFVSGLTNVGLNFLLIPHYGYMGAGIAKAVSYLILIILGIKITNSFMSWLMPISSFLKISFSALMMGISLFLLGNLLPTSIVNLIFLVVSGIFVYGLFLVLTKELRKEEIDLGKSLFKRSMKFVVRS